MPPFLMPPNVHTDNTHEETDKVKSSVWGHATESIVPWNLWGKHV